MTYSELEAAYRKILCAHRDCGRQAESHCDTCIDDTPFCSDHGSVGGDREGDETSLCVAVPARCWKCGGFNVDA